LSWYFEELAIKTEERTVLMNLIYECRADRRDDGDLRLNTMGAIGNTMFNARTNVRCNTSENSRAGKTEAIGNMMINARTKRCDSCENVMNLI
jgi:hypothetical protein